MTSLELYNKNKQSRIGEECICPSCGEHFIKISYHQAFCKYKPKTECKDKFWNKQRKLKGHEQVKPKQTRDIKIPTFVFKTF